MTKKVRIENADATDHKLIVEVWQYGVNGSPDVLQDTKELNNPADLMETYIWGSRYLVVKEVS